MDAILIHQEFETWQLSFSSVVDHYYKMPTPYNIHELLAQFAEKHVTD